ncbi:MAG: glycosyltransferase [Dysgonamonadaceae bacterium]|jgi:glycosyltransferase involved in cell wall biosynthesis|nr:glycosyltransferase [Dysgonamonadaceae bacterium]
MNDSIKVSIVTPSFNQGQFIEKTILSVLNQSYKNIEYILIDGVSTDNTMEIVNKYRDKIDIIISEKDKGQSDAITKGFELCTGELAGWINSDDLLYPDCVEKIVGVYNDHPDGSIFYPSTLDFIDKDGKPIFKRTLKISNKNFLLNNDFSIIQQGSFYKTEYLKKVGYVDENIYYCMDLDLWLRLLDHGPIYYYENIPLSAFRIWEATKTTLAGLQFLANVSQTLDKHGAKKISIAKIRIFYMRFRIILGKIKRFIFKKF